MKTAKSTKDKVKAILGYEPQIDMSKHSRIRRIWAGMKSRCYNSNNYAYKYYGQKGIYVCNEWLQFPNFVAWAFTNGSYRQSDKDEWFRVIYNDGFWLDNNFL